MRQLHRLGAAALLFALACENGTSTVLPSPDVTANASKGGGGGGGGGGSTIFVTSASLLGTALSINGVGAIANATMSVNGIAMGAANITGSFSITNAAFTSKTCTVTVSDGKTSASATLSPCTPGGSPAASIPKPLSPAAGASVLQPVTLSWSSATGATPVVAYNWQLATSSTFTALVLQGSTNAPLTTSTFSGLPNGTYWWRIQAIEQGTPIGGEISDGWSTPVSFTIAGSVAGTPGAPTITFPLTGAQYHPFEFFYPHWTTVANAASYVIEYSLDANFTPGSSQAGSRVTTGNTDTTRFGNPITLWARVRGVSATGVLGVPSASTRIVVTYTAPIGPAPSIVSPVNGAVVTQPFTFHWTEVQNPQLEGYTLEIANEPTFRGDCAFIEYCDLTITGPSFDTALAPGLQFAKGTHYWRVRSIQGDSSPDLPALTAWSKTGSFVVP